jgi:transcriptional regulator NrdR family protein
MEPFQRDKLFISIYESCKHRPTAVRDAGNLTQQIITKLLAVQTQPGLIARTSIIETCKKVLKPFDVAAATSYSAYHPL